MPANFEALASEILINYRSIALFTRRFLHSGRCSNGFQWSNSCPLRFFFFNYLFIIYFWLCWVFVSVPGLSPVAASGGHSSLRCAGLSLSRPLLLRSTGSRRAGSVVVAYGPSCSAACGIFPDQGSNPCALHWQADSQPLCHQGSPPLRFWYATGQDSLNPLSYFPMSPSGLCYGLTSRSTMVLWLLPPAMDSQYNCPRTFPGSQKLSGNFNKPFLLIIFG